MMSSNMQHKRSEVDSIERGEVNMVPSKWITEKSIQELDSPTTTTVAESAKESHEIPKTHLFLRNWTSLLKKYLPSWNTPKPYDSPLVVRKLKAPPEGYPQLACFLDSNEDFMIYRRFGFLQSRLLLHKQDELRELEEKLDKMDQSDSRQRRKILKSRDLDDVTVGDRKILLAETSKKFEEYANLLNAASTMMAFGKPASRDYNSVKAYFDDEQPVCEDEFYINCKEDVITLKPGRENAWLDKMVEKGLKRFSCPFLRWIFCSKETVLKMEDDEETVLYTKERIEYLVTFIITTMILALLILPVYTLWHLSGETQTQKTTAITLAVLLIFTLIFSGVLSFFTRAKRHEILGCAAGYVAVLVVFIGNVGPNCNGAIAGA